VRESKTVLSACVDKSIYACVKKIADSMGISLSEYVRRLIINDLDRRTVFTSALKQES
jgi:antitoxin component of RelBE/YafQ-DinJ toxin-antitoxin module